MEVLLLAIGAAFAIVMLSGWLLLLVTPLLVLSTSAVGGVVKGVAQVHHRVPAFARDTMRGILYINGLSAEPSLAKRLRSDIARLLKLAPAGTHPRACACVKQVDGESIGVLRIFNSKGHYLLRTSGDTAAAVAERFSTTLSTFKDTFPAKVGARRASCAECNPKTCPLRQLKRRWGLSAPAA